MILDGIQQGRRGEEGQENTILKGTSNMHGPLRQHVSVYPG